MKKKKTKAQSRILFLPVIFAASALTLTSCDKEDVAADQAPAPEMSGDQAQQATATSSEGKYLVSLNEDAGDFDAKAQDVMPQSGARKILTKMGKLQVIHADMSPEEAEKLRSDPRVAAVEKDQPIQAYQTTTTTTTTTGTTQVVSWGATRVGYGSGVGKTAWVIDSGVQLNHPDLTVDVARSRSFIPTSTTPDDQYGHGTMVAGIIAAKNNSYGTVGIAAGATIVSLRVLDANGQGMNSYVVSALNHVALYGKPGDVVNISLGSSASSVLDNAVKAVAAKGIFVTMAAGNSSANVVNYSPQRVNAPNVYTVSGLKAGDLFMGISNYGSPTVDFCAPGNSIHTTKKGGLYGSSGGTSMAAPHVAGLLLLKGTNIASGGFVASGDPDGTPDRIPHL